MNVLKYYEIFDYIQVPDTRAVCHRTRGTSTDF